MYNVDAKGKRSYLNSLSREMVSEMGTKHTKTVSLSTSERAYLNAGVNQPGGKLPIFDRTGQTIPASVIRSCIKKGLAEQWFANPMKPDWLVCRLTDAGRQALK